jgi:hypothetical protein
MKYLFLAFVGFGVAEYAKAGIFDFLESEKNVQTDTSVKEVLDVGPVISLKDLEKAKPKQPPKVTQKSNPSEEEIAQLRRMGVDLIGFVDVYCDHRSKVESSAYNVRQWGGSSQPLSTLNLVPSYTFKNCGLHFQVMNEEGSEFTSVIFYDWDSSTSTVGGGLLINASFSKTLNRSVLIPRLNFEGKLNSFISSTKNNKQFQARFFFPKNCRDTPFISFDPNPIFFGDGVPQLGDASFGSAVYPVLEGVSFSDQPLY